MTSDNYRKEERREEIYEMLTQQISAIGSEVIQLKKLFESHYQEDTEWKEHAAKAVELGNNIQGFGTVAKWIVGGLLAAASLVGSLYATTEWLRGTYHIN